jgi:hypothetical protein
MDGDAKTFRDTDPQGWARALAQRVAAVLDRHPDADPDTVRHTFILLEFSPLERLERALLRSGKFSHRK